MSAAPADPMAAAREQMRRARLFGYLVETRDLVAFDAIADWCAREPNGIDRSTGRHEQAVRDLGDAVCNGEFGPPSRPTVYYLPRDLPVYRPFWVRRTAGQLAYMRAQNHDETRHLWAPREACMRWMIARGITPPPWSRHAPPTPAPAPAALPIYRTGAPGRPSSIDLLRAEMQRRAAAGEMLPSCKRESEALAAWLKAKHPAAPTTGAKTMQNSLAALWRELSRNSSRKEMQAG